MLANAEYKNGRIFCPIKKKWYKPSDMHVSHYIDRAIYHLRYDLRNCHLISKDSNINDSNVLVEGYKSLHHKEYEEYLGEELVKTLKEESKNIRMLGEKYYKEIIENLKTYE